MKQSVVSGVLVFNDKNEVLLVKKPDGVGPYPGTYLTPGGGVHIAEPADKAATRELYEETGVEVKNLKRMWFSDVVTPNWEGVETHYIMLFYTAEYVSGNLQSTEEEPELEIIQWFDKKEVQKLPL